jgi:hypothetical protein
VTDSDVLIWKEFGDCEERFSMRSKKTGKKKSRREPDFSYDTVTIFTRPRENLLADMWKAEWKNVQQDLELYPQNNAERELCKVLESKLYARWMSGRRNYILRADAPAPSNGIKIEVEEDPPVSPECPRWNTQIVYRSSLECIFGIVFFANFLALTFIPLIPLSFIFGIPYQPLIYLLFLSASIVMYGAPMWRYIREDKFFLRCYALPIISTIYGFINSSSISFGTILCLWIFTILYCILLRITVWLSMSKFEAYDPFGYAYIAILRNLPSRIVL